MRIDIPDFIPVIKRYSNHRAAWYYTAKILNQNFHNNRIDDLQKINCILELDANYVWGAENQPIQYNEPWIGFIHLPTEIPQFIINILGLRSIEKQISIYKSQQELCKGLICLSTFHAQHLKNIFKKENINIPVFCLKHPTIIPPNEDCWSLKKFINNENKKIIQIGWFLRKVFSIYLLPESSKFIKSILPPILKNKEVFYDIMEKQKIEVIENGFKIYKNVIKLDNLNNKDYDKLLSNNIVFIEFYVSSANNTIIECIARGTPILINKHPSVFEYLGENYCLYYETYNEAINKAENYFLLNRAHYQLLKRKHIISEDNFKEGFQNILDIVNSYLSE